MANICNNFVYIKNDENCKKFMNVVRRREEDSVFIIDVMSVLKEAGYEGPDVINDRTLKDEYSASIIDASETGGTVSILFGSRWSAPEEVFDIMFNLYGLTCSVLSTEEGNGVYETREYVSGTMVSYTDHYPRLYEEAKKHYLSIIRKTHKLAMRNGIANISSKLARLIKKTKKKGWVSSALSVGLSDTIIGLEPYIKNSLSKDEIEFLTSMEQYVRGLHEHNNTDLNGFWPV